MANLLFYTNKSNENAFNKNAKSAGDADISEHSFQKTLKSYQKQQVLTQDTQDTIEKNIDDRLNDKKKLMSKKASDIEYKFKENQVEKEQSEKNQAVNEDAISSIGIVPENSKILLIEMLVSLFINKDSNNSITTEGDFFENLKTIASSIQKIMGDKPVLSANIMNDIRMAVKSLLSQDIKLDISDESDLLNNIKILLGSFNYEDVVAGIEKQHILAGNIENTLYSNISDIDILDREIPYNSQSSSFTNLLSSNDVLLQVAKLEPKEFMAMLKTSGLGKMALVSPVDTETTPPTEIGDTGIIEDEIKGVLHSDKNNLLNYNLEENQTEEMASNIEPPMDSLLTESFKTNNNVDILDITEILDKNNPNDTIEIIQELAEKISVKLNANHQEVELQIKPESLGRLVLKVTLEDGVLSGRIFTTNKQTADILQRNLDDLKNALEQQGYKFSQLDVDVGNGRESGRFYQHWENPINFSRSKQSAQLFNDVDGFIEEKIKPASNRISLSKIDYFA